MIIQFKTLYQHCIIKQKRVAKCIPSNFLSVDHFLYAYILRDRVVKIIMFSNCNITLTNMTINHSFIHAKTIELSMFHRVWNPLKSSPIYMYIYMEFQNICFQAFSYSSDKAEFHLYHIRQYHDIYDININCNIPFNV